MPRHPGDDYDFDSLLRDFSAPVTAFDCGQLCAPKNGGVPLCCDGSATIPILYAKEWDLLRGRSNLWRRYRPRCSEGRELVANLPQYRLAVCKGAAHCERENRSLNCRSFPFMPYVDHDGEVAGLVFDDEAAGGKCPLTSVPWVVTRRYVREAIDFWRRIVAGDPDEALFYREESRRRRRVAARAGQEIEVLVEEGMAILPPRAGSRRQGESGARGKIVPYDRPAG